MSVFISSIPMRALLAMIEKHVKSLALFCFRFESFTKRGGFSRRRVLERLRLTGVVFERALSGHTLGMVRWKSHFRRRFLRSLHDTVLVPDAHNGLPG